jgi:hypothetical protein
LGRQAANRGHPAVGTICPFREPAGQAIEGGLQGKVVSRVRPAASTGLERPGASVEGAGRKHERGL